ncbi:MAG: Zn-ribbon domain-containing OB-fold protein [Deltaproteobacteria bacterium]|nr:Zn-ribbon domain-containing OB-fold protein [Deltaproteobacteria bacterium]
MADNTKTTQEETLDGTVVYSLPFPEDMKDLEKMAPIVIKQPYQINYLHSYGQDSPFFAGLTNKKLLGTKCKDCGHTFATPKLACMECGGDCEWVEMPPQGRIHTFTVCQFGSEEFLPECPFILALIEFDGVDTLFLTRLLGLDSDNPSMDWVGMKVKPKFKRLSKLKPTDVWFIPA